MKEYMLLMKGDDSAEISPQEIQKRMEGYRTWMLGQLEAGRYVAGQPLEPRGTWLKNSETVVTDGPYLEPKEIIGGYIIVKAKDLQEATEIAKTCPLLDHCEIFVRPLLSVPG